MNSPNLPPDLELRKNLIHQLQQCPIAHCHPEDCILFPVVKMKHSDRVRWLNALSLESLRFLTSCHYFCSGNPVEGEICQTTEH